MIVYVVRDSVLVYSKFDVTISGLRVAGVFSSLEKAQSFIKTRVYHEDYHIDQHEIDFIETEN